MLADDGLVALVIGVDGNAGVASMVSGARGGDDEIVARFPLRRLAFLVKGNRGCC